MAAPRYLMFRAIALTLRAGLHSQPLMSTFKFLFNAVQYPIDKLRRFPGTEAPGNLYRFVDDDGLWSFPVVKKFLGGKSKKIAIDPGHSIQTPVLGMALDQDVDFL